MGELHFRSIAAAVFVAYPLRLTGVLQPAFGLGSPLQTASPLNSLLSPPPSDTAPAGRAYMFDSHLILEHMFQTLNNLINRLAIDIAQLFVSSVRNTDSWPIPSTVITTREPTIRQSGTLPQTIYFSRALDYATTQSAWPLTGPSAPSL